MEQFFYRPDAFPQWIKSIKVLHWLQLEKSPIGLFFLAPVTFIKTDLKLVLHWLSDISTHHLFNIQMKILVLNGWLFSVIWEFDRGRRKDSWWLLSWSLMATFATFLANHEFLTCYLFTVFSSGLLFRCIAVIGFPNFSFQSVDCIYTYSWHGVTLNFDLDYWTWFR